LLLSKKEYFKNLDERYLKKNFDSFDLINEKLFSYKSLKEYFDLFKKNKFILVQAFAKISTSALKLLKDSSINEKLNKRKVPSFDRYCSGVYCWMTKE
jgi:hypothetical protein